MAGKIRIPHTCPKCGVVASTHKELEKIFGFRKLNSNTLTNQSWCKKCRHTKTSK